jgi:hypothetical protein
MAGRWKSWLIQKKAGFLASFEMFSALRAGLAGEVRAGSDFKARGAVFLRKAMNYGSALHLRLLQRLPRAFGSHNSYSLAIEIQKIKKNNSFH